ncbi:MAG: GTP-binding protein [Planctomycetaceae bacterium]|nr:GTP-binding protein [Planctomycetaceae bacterium]
MTPLPVTILSGFVGAGRTTVLNHLLASQPDLKIAIIVNSAVGEEQSAATESHINVSEAQEHLVELSSGCICCTLREDLLQEIVTIAQDGSWDYLLIESSGVSEPIPIAETFAFVDDAGDALSEIVRLDTLVTVVDAQKFMEDYMSTEELADRNLGAGEDSDDRDISLLLADQVEFANVVVINKCDLVAADQLAALKSLVQRMNPEALVIESRFGHVDPSLVMNTNRYSLEWAGQAVEGSGSALEGEAAATPENGISGFVFEARRPFHPQRFFDFWMNDECVNAILRSRGYFWLATRNSLAGYWSQAGQVLSAEPGGEWWAEAPKEEWPTDEPEMISQIESVWQEPYGDRRQELVFIGQEMEINSVRAALEACLLTDEEYGQGPDGWADYEDPFESWDQDFEDHEHDHDHDCDHDHDH